jgi:protein-disulfide isomerase
MDTLQKSSVLPVVGVIGMCVIGVVLIGLFGRGGSTTSATATGTTLAIPLNANDHVLGDASAPVTIVEYADFQCPSCKATSPVLAKLVADEAGKVSVIYRYFTLPQHINAVPAARAAEAAALQGKFWDMHDKLFDTQSDWELLPDPNPTFIGHAQTLGLDTTKFKADMGVEAVTARVASDTADAMTSHLDHTPTIFINGTEMTGSPTYDALKTAVDSAAAAKK